MSGKNCTYHQLPTELTEPFTPPTISSNKKLTMTSVELAQLFHNEYERLAPSFGYETRTETRQFDAESANGKLMIAVCARILDTLRG